LTDASQACPEELENSREATPSTDTGGLPPELEELKAVVRAELDALNERLDEHQIGGSRHPSAEALHRRDRVKERGDEGCKHFLKQLTRWSEEYGRIPSLYFVWDQTYEVLQVTLAYSAINVVKRAVDQFAGPEPDQSVQDWEARAVWALSQAMALITTDGELFQLVNLSEAQKLNARAQTAAEAANGIALLLNPLLNEHGRQIECVALTAIRDTACALKLFYEAGADAADAVLVFEAWMTDAPVLDSPNSGSSLASEPPGLDKVKKAICHIRQTKDKLQDPIRELCEPWERMLVEIDQIMTSREQHVFVPNRVTIRYCYPFAFDSDEYKPPWNDEKAKPQLEKTLEKALERVNIKMGQSKPLGASQFFHRDKDHYSGLHVDLQGGITLKDLPLPVKSGGGRGMRCKVWLELSDMGNHCLCIQPELLTEPSPHEPLTEPRPQELYRVVRAGTPFVVGETVVVNQPFRGSGEASTVPDDASWDTLHAFSRDVVVAVGKGMLESQDRGDRFFGQHFEPGNLHEAVVMKTNAPARPQPRAIAAALDRAVGGRIVLRSVHQAASTLAEWVRYPAVSHGRVPLIEDIPVVGLAGDWFTNTSEMTVFGFVAAPNWHSDVYLEAAQFANSWSPLLRMWSRRLQLKIQAAQADADKPGTRKSEAAADEIYTGESLRQIEARIRLHLAQIRAEDLCATRGYRLFLDQLLEMAQLDRLQDELEAQLVATEHLTDWFDENKRQSGERNRNVLLAFLTLLGIFGLTGYLGELNKDVGQKFLWLVPMGEPGVWEDNLVFLLFVVGLVLAVWFDIFFPFQAWVKDHLPSSVKDYYKKFSGKVRKTFGKVRNVFGKGVQG
jgi:hypothetical protein